MSVSSTRAFVDSTSSLSCDSGVLLGWCWQVGGGRVVDADCDVKGGPASHRRSVYVTLGRTFIVRVTRVLKVT